ncbi:unnamed protein product [Cylicocyclus nassatus]|uniref:tRNA/rRNA methyltransferase SpoU type domain-containing protein n=1 Tax=Cylicocyclus nassatus TaxID=53992 RepID=A0AA36H950_CYLNA|nr:unnamed protein product [Cylicocyclus nassatus]
MNELEIIFVFSLWCIPAMLFLSTMCGTLTTSEDVHTRSYFIALVDNAQSEDDVADLLIYFETLSGEELENALPSLVFLAEKCPGTLRSNFLNLIYCILTDSTCSRSGRKAAYACLRMLIADEESLWSNFLTLSQCLEEPQFHIIKPVLPKMDDVLNSVHSGLLDFKWASVIFLRALAHSNGWVRSWSLEKVVSVDAGVMAENKDFLLSVISEHLNSNDPFWRFLERDCLQAFLKSLGRLLEGVLMSLAEPDRAPFIKAILSAFHKLSSPTSLFFLSEAVMLIQAFHCLPANDLMMIETLVRKTLYIQHTTIKYKTIFNFVVFYCSMLEKVPESFDDVARLCPSFSINSPILFDKFIYVDSIREVILTAGEPSDLLQRAMLDTSAHQHTSEKDDFSSLIWVRASLSKKEDELLERVELELADRLTAVDDGVDIGLSETVVAAVDVLLCILLHSHKDLSLINQDLIQLVSGYLLLQIAIASKKHAYMIRNVYTSLIKRMKLSTKPFIELALSLITEQSLPFDRHAILLGVLHELLDDELDKEDSQDLLLKIRAYLGNTPLQPLRVKKDADIPRESYMNKVASTIHEYRLKLVLKVLPGLSANAEDMLSECVDLIDCASAYSVTECYLAISSHLLEKVTCEETLIRLINVAVGATNEERKSLNFLPAVRQTLRLFFSKPMMSLDVIRERVKDFCHELLDLAQLNTTVAFVLSEAILNAEHLDLLSCDWTDMIFALAVFGPIPKKEARVVDAAYEMIYKEIAHDVDDLQRPFEIMQRTRLNGICAALNLSKKDSQFADSLVDIIISETNIMNSSSSRSFGLSLAHRQNTRAVSLLLLIADFVSEESVLDKVFDTCVEWIVDPCQQFSIKLILEWLLVRIALRSPKFKQKMIDHERIFANKRIGSVSSWINMHVLMSRAEPSSAAYIESVLPWTTAQNFAVRCTAIAGLRLLYKSLNPEDRKRWQILQRIVDFGGEPTGNSQRIIDNLLNDFYFAHLHPVDHFDMQTVFNTVPSKTGMTTEELLPIELLQKFNTSSMRSLSNDQDLSSALSLVNSGLSKSSSCAPEISEELDSVQENGGSAPVQRKIITRQRSIREDCSLIVVASLVDKPNNLGGLCRTCEIFAVDTLVIADLVYTADAGFKSLSMSAEKKQKIEAVRPDDLLHYLDDLRKKGYTVVAAEQTTDSLPLHKYKFPLKTVLLLGDEKEGVPVRLLRSVDQTVEIEQLGQTRSLNTVTIFWILIWVYASITAVTSGFLWSLEWLGGPQSDRTAISHDITSEHYVDPNETNPETKKAIKYGSIILGVSVIVLVLKILAWNVARRVFKELRSERIAKMNSYAADVSVCRPSNIDRTKEFTDPLIRELTPMLPKPQPPPRLSLMQKESYI